MSSIPSAERPPEGLNDAYWLGVWRHALKTLKEQGTWAWEQRPLLDEYVFALRAAESCRQSAEDTRWDRHSKRAAALAGVLALTPESRRRLGVGSEEVSTDPFAAFDQDELAERRAQKTTG